jgi:hypothetical protein
MNASYLLVEPVGGLYRIATSGGAIEVSEQELRWLCLVAGPAALPPLPSPAEKSRRQSEAGGIAGGVIDGSYDTPNG